MLRRRFDVDLLRERATPLAAWIVFGAGACALLLAAAQLAQVWEHRRLQAAAVARLLAEQGSQRERTERRTVAQKAAQVALRREAQGILVELHRPWSGLFDDVESALDPGVRLTQVGVERRFAGLQVQAEARDLAALIALVQRLERVRAVASARLVHHEWRDGPAGRVVSARIVAVLRPVADSGSLSGGEGAAAARLVRTELPPGVER